MENKSARKQRIIGWRLICCFCLMLLTSCQQKTESTPDTILVFAAASLRDVMQEIAGIYQQQTGVHVTFNFAGSNVLAQQIAAAPKADIFLSANTHWMDYLVQVDRVDVATQRPFLSNNLVFITHKDSGLELTAAHKLMNLPFRFLSIGDPQAVPAGHYAKAYLSSVPHNQQNLWHSVSHLVLPASDVKAATAMVETMPDIIGMVYKTDALASSNVRILYEPQSDGLMKIQYVGAKIKQLSPNKSTQPNRHAMSFLDFLSQADSTAIFQQHGFQPLTDLQTADMRGGSH